MYLESAGRLRPGQVVAEPMLASDGTVLIAAGTVLGPRLIEKLRERGIAHVTLRDGLADGVRPDHPVKAQTRRTVTHTLEKVFAGVHVATLAATSTDGRAGCVAETTRRLGDRPLPVDEQTRADLEALQSSVEQLIEEVLDGGALKSLESLKGHNDYTFEHSVDVAVTSTLLGHLAGLRRDELSALALGGLLHDVGKTFVDLRVLEKPGPLDPAEREEIERHPRMGFELVKRLPLASILPAHIALQHHERQDGTGYPNGLEGANRLERRTAERLDPRRMLLLAEVCAVADVHSALTSDRPYRPAMTPEHAREVLTGMAGRHLNRELVTILHAGVPIFTVGRWVALVGGPFDGWRGVVTKVCRESLDRPGVRLLVTADGREAARPVELDLADEPEALLRSVPPGNPVPDREHASATA